MSIVVTILFWVAFASVKGLALGGGLKPDDPAAAVSSAEPEPSTTPRPRGTPAPTPTPVPVPAGFPQYPAQPSDFRTETDVAAIPSERPAFETSKRWRVLGGAVSKETGRAVVVLSSGTGRQILSDEECELDDQFQWRCETEDGQATPWSGGAYNRVSAARPEGSLTPG